MSTEELLRKQLLNAFESRAVLYELLLDVLQEEHTRDHSVAIVRKVLNRWGAAVAAPALVPFAPADLDGLATHLCASSPDEGRMFKPERRQPDAQTVEIHFTTCPFKDTWERRGLSPDHISLLCDLTSEFDRGKLSGAGFGIVADCWTPGTVGCCTLRIKAEPG